MEREVEMLKEREIDQKNQASGYETLLRDKIPLNEHILALKNKFNQEKKHLQKEEELLGEEIKKEQLENRTKEKKIEIMKQEYEDGLEKFQKDKESGTKTLQVL